MLSSLHNVGSGEKADTLVDGKITVEVGGENKGHDQTAGGEKARLALDELPMGAGRRIALWLFGFQFANLPCQRAFRPRPYTPSELHLPLRKREQQSCRHAEARTKQAPPYHP
jgi:hypothetical protein